MKELLSLKVTKIKKRWHARLKEADRLIGESACELKEDVGYICRDLFRWYGKLGGVKRKHPKSGPQQPNPSKFKLGPAGKVWLSILDPKKEAKKAKPLKISDKTLKKSNTAGLAQENSKKRRESGYHTDTELPSIADSAVNTVCMLL